MDKSIELLSVESAETALRIMSLDNDIEGGKYLTAHQRKVYTIASQFRRYMATLGFLQLSFDKVLREGNGEGARNLRSDVKVISGKIDGGSRGVEGVSEHFASRVRGLYNSWEKLSVVHPFATRMVNLRGQVGTGSTKKKVLNLLLDRRRKARQILEGVHGDLGIVLEPLVDGFDPKITVSSLQYADAILQILDKSHEDFRIVLAKIAIEDIDMLH